MARHYSEPRGFVGRNICYAITVDNIYYGHIVSGSATQHLPGRHDALGTTDSDLQSIINNIFFHIEPVNGRYPIRNFATAILRDWRQLAAEDWEQYYGEKVLGFESLVELPRTGECYRRDGWIEVGQTIGYTCKREAGWGTDSWSGRRVWDTKNLRPKRVFIYPLYL